MSFVNCRLTIQQSRFTNPFFILRLMCKVRPGSLKMHSFNHRMYDKCGASCQTCCKTVHHLLVSLLSTNIQHQNFWCYLGTQCHISVQVSCNIVRVDVVSQPWECKTITWEGSSRQIWGLQTEKNLQFATKLVHIDCMLVANHNVIHMAQGMGD